jgi:cytokinin dehydrogenase
MLSRRQILGGAGATAILGFHPVARAWVGNGTHGAFDRAPRLDGALIFEPSAIAPYSGDAGNIIFAAPVAVLLPGSVEDIQRMVRFCKRHRIKVAARGQGHTTFGQSLVGGGLVVDMATMATIHSIGPTSADVAAGLKWSDLVPQTVARGLTPPVLTGYLSLSVGGTLSVGGISSTLARGAQVDYVRELDVVTGNGELLTCSMARRRDLFEAVLAGLGQCGIITRAVVDLVPAKARSRVYTIDYTDSTAFFADLRTLLAREEFDDVYNFGLPGPSGGWVYQLTATKHFDPATPPDGERLLQGLRAPVSAAIPVEMTFLEYALRVDVVIDFFRQIGLWDGVAHPWFDVFLPEQAVESYVTNVTSSLTPEDVGSTGNLLLLPKRAARLSRPMLRVPRSRWIFLFDILTSASVPGPDPAFERRMLDRNRRLFESARRVGGTRYPIGSLRFSRLDWLNHYGEQWARLARAKRRYDPAEILTPGPGIFA